MKVQAADTVAVKKTPHFRPQAYVQAGYVSELWTLNGTANKAYSAANYNGAGYFSGIGFTATHSKHPQLGYGLSADYLQYNMQSTLKENTGLPVTYSFARITPAIYLQLNKNAPVSILLSGVVHAMAALQTNSSSYYQAGINACARYKAIGLNIGCYFKPSGEGPAKNAGDLREQMVNIGIVCYPGQLKDWEVIKSAVKGE